MGLVNSSRKT